MSYVCVICVYTYFTGIAPCMGLRVAFVLFLLSKYYDYVYTFDYMYRLSCERRGDISFIARETISYFFTGERSERGTK